MGVIVKVGHVTHDYGEVDSVAVHSYPTYDAAGKQIGMVETWTIHGRIREEPTKETAPDA